VTPALRLPEKPRVPALALRLEDAAAALGVSLDFFNENVRPEVRVVRRGRLRLVPVAELERWLSENAAYAVEP
jgi:hypothetical protein